MAELTTVRGTALGREHADVALGPVVGDDNHQDLGTSVGFEIGEPGDAFVASATGKFHLLCGTSDVTATTSCPVFEGAVRLTLPDGCTHVAMLEAETDVSGCAYKA